MLVYDLGGGTFDLSLVSYERDQVKVIASSGDLHLGGIDWNQRLMAAVADQFGRIVGAAKLLAAKAEQLGRQQIRRRVLGAERGQ
ncbi:MAG: Hsp70 family protein [Cyanobacteria bacterium]|nr:Hsp70 family protein [Cyanobacteriota bacterium]